MPDLKELATQMKAEADARKEEILSTQQQTPVSTPPIASKPVNESVSLVDEDDDPVMLSAPPSNSESEMGSDSNTSSLEDDMSKLKDELSKKETSAGTEDGDDTTVLQGVKTITNEEIKNKIAEAINALPIPGDSADVEGNAILTVMTRYRKRLLVEEGLTDAELNEALTKRLDRELNALEIKYGNKSNTVVINVPEVSSDKVEFTEAQLRKMDSASKIQLFKVEKKELGTLKLKNVKRGDAKLKYIKDMNASYISKYSVPLPHTGEFATFRGALVAEMMQARATDEKESPVSIAVKKANLAYTHLVEGVIQKVKDESGAVLLSYTDFLKKFRYFDLDLMVYAITCATSGPLTVSHITCPSCGQAFDKEINVPGILVMDDKSTVPEVTKKTFDEIVEKHTQPAYMENLKVISEELVRYESPFTHNIYDIGTPSIERGLEILSITDIESNDIDRYIGSLALFVHGMYMYNEVDDDYIPIEETEYSVMLESLRTLPQTELTMLSDIVADMSYTPQFVLNTKCPECGHKVSTPVPVNDLVFFAARELQVTLNRSEEID